MSGVARLEGWARIGAETEMKLRKFYFGLSGSEIGRDNWRH
jgi:hypothetical protein